MTVGAIIVTYQTPAQALVACQASLRTANLTDIVVVDNSPQQAIRAVTSRHGARYLAQRTNRGFAAAANIGAACLDNDYLLFLNPDAALTPKACRLAQRYLSAHPACGIVGLLLTSPRGHPERRSFGDIVTPLTLFTRHLQLPRLLNKPSIVGWVSGGALMIRRNLFRQLGGFDPEFFLYWEDVDLCRRARQLGWHTVLLPQAVVTHRRGASLSDIKRKTALYDKSADKYFRKHYAKAICLIPRYLRFLYRLVSPRVD